MMLHRRKGYVGRIFFGFLLAKVNHKFFRQKMIKGHILPLLVFFFSPKQVNFLSLNWQRSLWLN